MRRDIRPKMRRPQRVKPRFQFARREVELCLTNPLRWKTFTLNCLGDFGYKKEEDALPGSPKFHITHTPTGMRAATAKTEKEAKILCKRLFSKVKTRWTPNREDIVTFSNFNDECVSVLNTHERSYNKQPGNVVPRFQTHNISPEDYDDDIPF